MRTADTMLHQAPLRSRRSRAWIASWLVLLASVLLVVATTSAEESRVFRDTKGRELKGRITRVVGETIHLRREDGSSFEVGIETFSKADQDYIRQWSGGEPETDDVKTALDLSKVSEVPDSRIGRFKSPSPPKVVMGMAYIPKLADVDPNKWTYVRENLDGLWLNAAGTGIGDLEKLASKIKTRRYYFICPVSKLEFDDKGSLLDVEFRLAFYDRFKNETKDPCLVLVNDYITKSGKAPERYYCDNFLPKAIEHLEKEYTAGKNPFGRRLFITTRNGQFANDVYDKTFDKSAPKSLKGRAFSTMQYAANGGGIVYETDFFGILDHHQQRYIEAFNRARELGAKLVWLCPRGHQGTPQEYSKAMVDAYAWMRKNQLFPDEIVIIHYSRTAATGTIDYLDMLPMVNEADPSLPAPGSFTGALYWAIKQREAAITK